MNSDWHDRIESDPQILDGKPCFRETRIPVGLVLGYLASGRTAGEILVQLPGLETADIIAAIEYARDLANFEAVVTA